MLTYKVFKINDKVEIVILDISGFDIEEKISENIIKICEGDIDTDISVLKIRLKDYLQPKTDKQKKGAVAEFYAHMFFNQIGYKQEFKFLNLEENSIKKGFDGDYTYCDEEWILESKSGNGVTHAEKIKEAYSDLSEKLTTKAKNNPWENAYNHASMRAVGSKESLISKLKKLSDDYVRGIRLPITNYNLIPCGTVFEHDASESTVKEEIFESLKILHLNMQANKLMLVAVSNRAYKKFLEYIDLV